VWLSAERRGSVVEIIVEDEGAGIDPDIEGRLFEPFATTKPPGEGTGLGLYASYMLVQTMGGDLTIQNRDQRGASARVRLPAGAQSLAKEPGVHHRAPW
jgi:C4-dicarboxylate-specific signal transduction histidine kinase